MKMPLRPWYPPITPQTDVFGLHHVSLLGAALESDAERDERIARVEAGVLAAFKAAIEHLGEDQARELFKQMLRHPKRGLGKAHAPDRDARLLKAYDEKPVGETDAALARRLYETSGKHELGSGAAAIATQIRKLIKERDQRRHAAAKEERRWRMAMRNEPPTLLSSAAAREK